ncbi:hypothetical protein LCY76_14670 [Fictibacillus sp. KIGAM418]|uniref:Uncharacterized protein n=1 Tax=Fictibacillus marinisediminis TaxID=2878389 RepID=A0A9X1XDH4_9BACL|nr:hypothetical protein [Fictibacillus marinisediminis]MCK6257825.1 hypothetical protein [Fictibacillus marinisediminis]
MIENGRMTAFQMMFMKATTFITKAVPNVSGLNKLVKFLVTLYGFFTVIKIYLKETIIQCRKR